MEKTLLRPTKDLGNSGRAFHADVPVIASSRNATHSDSLPQIYHSAHDIAQGFLALTLGSKFTQFSFDKEFQSLRLKTGYHYPEGHGAAFKVLYYVKELVKWQKK